MDPYQKKIVSQKIKVLEHPKEQGTFPRPVDTLNYRDKPFMSGKELMKDREKLFL